MPSNTLHSFILSRKHDLDMRCWACYISLCGIYFICQKSRHRFLLISFSVIEDVVLIEIMK